MPPTSETLSPTEQDTRLAREAHQKLTGLVSREESAAFCVRTADHPEQEVCLPMSAIRVLLDVLQELGQGNGVTLTRVPQELTTQQAANFLGVSRPFLIQELLEKGRIPFRKVGNRRRIRYADLLRYQHAEEQEIARREQVMLALVAETERLGLYR